MQQFTIPTQGIIAMRKEILRRTLPVIIIGGAIPFIIELVQPCSSPLDYLTLLIIVPILFIVIRFTLSRGIKKQVFLLESYSLVINEKAIIRQQGDTFSVSILFEDITTITKNRNGSFTIKSRQPQDIINIPAQIGNYDMLEGLLNQIRPIRVYNIPGAETLRIPLVLLGIGLLLLLNVARNKILIATAGTLLIAFLIWGFIDVQRSKNVTRAVKNGSFMIFLVIVSILSVLYIKLTGHNIFS